MTRWSFNKLLAAPLLIFASNAAHAHTGADHAVSFVHGFSHPFGGVDHVMAMVMVGVLAAQLGGRTMWVLPAGFVAAMAVAGLAGSAGVTLPHFELGIAASVIVLGALVAFRFRAGVPIALSLVGFFAIFHGYAHGVEVLADANGLLYGLGFVAATTVLHCVGVFFGVIAGERNSVRNAVLMRSVGAAVACVGIGLLSGMV